MRRVRVGAFEVGEGRPLALIGGPCVIEEPERALRIAARLAAICQGLGVNFIFKASFDKANRTSGESFRGPGLEAGLQVLAQVQKEVGCPVTTDVHETAQVAPVAAVVDLLQIPAFLCRQTDLLEACARTERPVNIKKGQFLSPLDCEHVVAKAREAGAKGIILTERGTTFGYNNLVVDMRGIPIMQRFGVPVCFDMTHSVQAPGGFGAKSGGDRAMAPILARAAIAVGADLLFAEVHDDPSVAKSDAATQLPLDSVEGLLGALVRLAAAR